MGSTQPNIIILLNKRKITVTLVAMKKKKETILNYDNNYLG